MKPDLPTDPAHWQRIEALLDEMFERPVGERRAFLDEACAGDPELRAQMEALLAADEKAGDFLARPAQEAVAALLADTSSNMAPLAEGHLGPYRLVREIGSGGMGVVYEAEDTRLRRRVAIKLLPPEYSRDRAAKERFLREARAASALDDPNICTVHDIGEHEGQLYIVMAYYEGETLKERLARGPLPVSEARQVAVEVARALVRAHEAGIVHRDIKPANVMLTRHGKVKVLDFGIAKMRGDTTLTRTGNSPGTPAYMSPEQARGEPVDGRSDLWSLGALLYEMLASRRPFQGEDERAVLAAVQSRQPDPLHRIRPEVPPELARTVAKALAKAPSQRYQSAAELLADLESGRRPRRRLVPALSHWRPGRGLRVVLLVGAVVATVLLGFLAKNPFRRLFPAPEVRVAVLRPALASKDPEHAFVESDVMEAVLASLTSLEGVHPIDPPYKEEESGSEAERLRRAEADEVIHPLLDCRGDWCRVKLRRLREPGNVVLATVGPFEVESGIENVQRLAEGVRVNLQQLYSDHQLRPESQGSKVRPEDYSAYVKLERRAKRGERLGPEGLDQLDALLQTSPDFLGALLLAADTARGLPDVHRALGYTSQAEAIALNDPRPLFSRFRVEMAGRRFEEAEVTLKRLSRLVPDDARVPRAEADLLEARGELEEAYRLRQEVVRRRPVWPQMVELATLSFRLGASETDRRRLRELLKAQPVNQYVREALALLELGGGDPGRAAALYEELIHLQSNPPRRYFTNLGFIQYVLGDYAAAEQADRQALVLEPGHIFSRFNLATALKAQGKLQEAGMLFRTLAEDFAVTPDLMDTHMRVLYAQCLARLGRRGDAIRLAEEALKKVPQDIQVLHQAAQLYALLGEPVPALYYIQRALKKGMRREWFTIPEFDSLKEDPTFQDLIKAGRPERAGVLPGSLPPRVSMPMNLPNQIVYSPPVPPVLPPGGGGTSTPAKFRMALMGFNHGNGPRSPSKIS